MTIPSVLFQVTDDRTLKKKASEPGCFRDLNLDRVINAITADKDEYDLKPFFYRPLRDLDDIAFRHEVLQDLSEPRLLDVIKAFAESMRAMRKHLAQAEKLHYRLQKHRWILDGVNIYCDAVSRLANDLSRAKLASRGLSAFRDHVSRYVDSERFTSSFQRTKKLTADLSAIHYNVLIRGLYVEVHHHEGEPDYSAEVEATFEKFKQGDVKGYPFSFADPPEMNHVEVAILDLVAELYPETFAELEDFAAAHKYFVDPGIATFDREVQFYIAYLEYMAPFKQAGLDFCYPRVIRDCKEVYDYQGFDLALAGKLACESKVPVCNDFHLRGRERIIVVSGPNQGGKTTFARTFGQLHYLAALGCPVPGTHAQLFLFDRLLTHFEREEDIGNLRGKLQDDLIRVHDILSRATPDSIVIMNEVFTSTTFRDASLLSKKIAAQIIRLDLLCVWVTFLDELAALGPQTVSMVSTVVPENPAVRTFKIVRRPADGLAYALSIAEKYGLTHDLIRERLRS